MSKAFFNCPLDSFYTALFKICPGSMVFNSISSVFEFNSIITYNSKQSFELHGKHGDTFPVLTVNGGWACARMQCPDL